MTAQVIFVTGIDTDIGKTIATGFYAQQLAKQSYKVITQKMIQTGCQNISDDILVHRRMQGLDLLPEDSMGLTCPYLFDYPCSPHVAAALAQVQIEDTKIDQATAHLAQHYDYILLEGAGGLAVPYTGTKTTLDFIAERQYPIILVSSGKLGSINHTLLSLMACQTRRIKVHALIYNLYPNKDPMITRTTQAYLKDYLAIHHPEAQWIEMPEIGE